MTSTHRERSRRRCCVAVYPATLAVTVVLLVLAVGATAASTGYDMNEVKLTATPSSAYVTYDASTTACAASGGVLIPDATNPMHAAIKSVMAEYNTPTSFFTYLGGSTKLSTNCPTTSASTNCVWYWDVGRYAGIENAAAFYIGNLHAYLNGYGGLQGSQPVDIAMQYWMTNDNNDAIYPGSSYGQYVMMVRTSTKFPSWVDANAASFPYASSLPITTGSFYVSCLNVVTTTTTTTSTSTTTTTTTTSTTTTTTTSTTTTTGTPDSTTTTTTTTEGPPPSTSTTTRPPASSTTTTAPPSQTTSGSKKTSMGVWIGIGVAVAAVVIIAAAIVVCCARQRHWWCFSAGAAAPTQRSRAPSSTVTGSSKSNQSSLESDEDTPDESERSFSSGDGNSPQESPYKVLPRGSSNKSMALPTFKFPDMDTPSPASPPARRSASALTNAYLSTSTPSVTSTRSGTSAAASYAEDAFSPSVSPLPLAEDSRARSSFSGSLSTSSAMMRRMRRKRRVSFLD